MFSRLGIERRAGIHKIKRLVPRVRTPYLLIVAVTAHVRSSRLSLEIPGFHARACGHSLSDVSDAFAFARLKLQRRNQWVRAAKKRIRRERYAGGKRPNPLAQRGWITLPRPPQTNCSSASRQMRQLPGGRAAATRGPTLLGLFVPFVIVLPLGQRRNRRRRDRPAKARECCR